MPQQPDPQQSVPQQRGPRRPTRASALALVSAFAVGAALAVPGAAFAGDKERPHGQGKPRADVVQHGLDRLVWEDGVPAALASVTDRKGRDRDLVAGVGDLATGARVPVDGQVRIGSNSKTFVAATVLQLVGEGLIGLDEPIEAYLPGLVRGDGVDGHDITVRDLLQHTSGIRSYTDGPPFLQDGVPDLAAITDWYVEPHELLDLALAMPTSGGGKAFAYSNTNYLLAGLIVQKATGRPLAEAITERIIEPLGLRSTYVPDRGERGIRGPHPHGYFAATADEELVDVTNLDSSQAWASGDVVSTPSDLNAFFSALLGGKVLQPAELAQMKTVITPDGLPEGFGYGLGLTSTALSCGDVAWGHGGAIAGYLTEGGVTDSGRAVTVAVTALDVGQADTTAHLAELVDTALCS
ncbi:serine hydrolase domain-containing protein [Cellulomonas timonensis]|uniref:serine hydrolase domain-containing protein n=1 Tax=Cellulomonas timonensis TaxID=1689271 RepID=UPI000830C408|nr:serine hydrolase domain-containing protein [Cellulomonas timonensis]